MHFFQIIFPYKSLYNTEYGFLPYTVGPWSLLYIWYSVCVNPKPLIHPYPLTFHFGIQKLVFCVYASISVLYILLFASASMVAQTVKPLPAKRRPRFNPWVRKSPWRRKWQPTPVFLPGEFHGQRSLVGYSPWGRREWDMTERFHFHFSYCFPKWLHQLTFPPAV